MKIICPVKTKKKININTIIFLILMFLLMIIDAYLIMDISKDIKGRDTAEINLPSPTEIEKDEEIDYLTAEVETLLNENQRLENELRNLQNKLDNMSSQEISEAEVFPRIAYSAASDNTQWVYHDNSITNVTNASKEEMALLIERIIVSRNGSVDNEIINCIDSFIYVEKEYGISATAMLSIITWETGFDSVFYNERNNVAGIKDSSGKYRYFNSKDESILYMGQLLMRYVKDYGLSSWHEIGNKYCDTEWSEDVSATTIKYNEYLDEIRKSSISE